MNCARSASRWMKAASTTATATRLYGMLTRLGCDIVDMGVVKDDPAALEAAFRSACENADAIITSGGVSVGEADYTKQMMAQLGDVAFWTIGMRPGRPMAFGKISSNGKSAYLFGLPGNPVAVMVTFLFLRPRSAAAHDGRPGAAAAAAARQLASRDPQEARPHRIPARHPVARRTTASSRCASPARRARASCARCREANCMVVLQHEQGNVQAGDGRCGVVRRLGVGGGGPCLSGYAYIVTPSAYKAQAKACASWHSDDLPT